MSRLYEPDQEIVFSLKNICCTYICMYIWCMCVCARSYLCIETNTLWHLNSCTTAQRWMPDCNSFTSAYLGQPLLYHSVNRAPPPVTWVASLEAQAGPVIQLTFIGPCITYAASTGCMNGATATCKCQLPYFPLTFISNGNMSYVE